VEKSKKKQPAITLKQPGIAPGFFCGQTALSLRPYDCNAHIIPIGCFSVMSWLFEKVKKNRSYV
jgi:hypothetical protein